MRLSYVQRDRITETVIENYGGVSALQRDLQSGEFEVSTLKGLIREGIWIAGIEIENEEH